MAAIAADGRVIFTATISCSSSTTQAQTDLLADTGSHRTIISDTLLASFQGHYSTGAIIPTNVAGSIVEINGLIIEVQVENHGGGSHQTKQTNRTLYAHSLGLQSFPRSDGLLGMDVFDAVQADPVKDQPGGTTYLAQRV